MHGMNVVDKQNSYKHRAFLTGVLADSPARCKLTRWSAVSAYLACGWCLFQGGKYETSSDNEHIYYKGYAKDVVHDIPDYAHIK